MLTETTELRDRLESNTQYFRTEMTSRGFQIKPGVHPIIPIMLGDAKLANDFVRDMLDEGIYVIGFSYPEVLYQEASYLLKKHNPCQMHKGKCLRSIGPCCDRCKYLGDKGSTVKALYCKVWLCYEARHNNPKLAEKLNDLTEIADKYGLLMIRSMRTRCSKTI